MTLTLVLPGLTMLAGCGARAESRPNLGRYETWQTILVQGSKIGYSHQLVEPDAEQGTVHLTGELEMVARRYGEQSQLSLKAESWETADGRLLRFRTENHMSGVPSVTKGRVDGDKLYLQTASIVAHSAAPPPEQEMPWSSEFGGFGAVERSLREKPLKPGESRIIRSLEPLVNRVATTELRAQDFEEVDLPQGTRRLLRVHERVELAGTRIESAIWIDSAGEVWKSHTELMKQDSFRATREQALEPASGQALDIGLTSAVRLKGPIDDPHKAAEIRYLVTMTDGDPAEVFPTSPGQSLRKLGPHSAELTVRAIRPAQDVAGPAAPSGDTPTEADRQPNSLIQSDDARVQAMASEAAGNETDPWKVAQRLETFVHRAVRKKNFSQVLGSAAEVARTGEGDCTEHAVLLAALARARGIPSRVAVGLVYVPAEFGYHMWTEVYVRGQWIPLDATLGQGGIGAGHLKIAQSTLAGSDHLANFLPVVQAMGRLKLDVLSRK